MKSFLRQTGNMQYLNFVSPFMIGINGIQLKPGHYFNFAFRSVPASFGYYAGGDFFFDCNNRQLMISAGFNKSKSLTLPALDVRYYNLIKKENTKFNTNISLSAWMQPEDQIFFAGKAVPGMTIGIQPAYEISRYFSLIVDVSYKTKGWVFGNSYLDSKLTGRIGFSLRTL
ncbi:MAG: hypothetical protein QM768_15160 [Agriterribacter sp.]